MRCSRSAVGRGALLLDGQHAAFEVGMKTIDALEGSFRAATPLFESGQFRGDVRGFLLQAFALLTQVGKLGLQLVEAGLGLWCARPQGVRPLRASAQ